MRRIKVLLMLLAIVAGGVSTYGQTSPQDTYYKFNQTYVAGATVAPYEGNGGDLTVGQAVIAKNPAAEYMQNTYSYGISTTVSANGTKVTRKMLTFHVEASTDNPAHILLICKDYKATTAATDNYWGIYIASNSQWKTRQIIRPTHIDNDLYRMGCYEFVVNETNDYDLSAVGVTSSGKAEVYELRVIYEKNALYQSIRNSLAIEFNNSTTTADRATTSFFRLCQTRPFDEVNGVQTLGGGVYFRPYANGTIVVDLINNNDQTAGIALDSILVFTNVSSGIQNLHASTVDANTTVNDFTLPRKVYKGGEYRLGYNTGSYIKSVRFIPDHYTVTLNPNGGTVDPTELVYIKGGDPITAFPTPSKENYMFDGWDPAAPSFPYAPTADITYTAQWTNPHGQCGDNLTWELNPSTGVLTITGTGEMYDYSSTTQPWKDYKAAITTVALPDGLTKIGNSAFTSCSHLASVTIPDGVTIIDQHAFQYCSSLTEIVIPNGVTKITYTCFMGCTNLKRVTIPSSVTQFFNFTFKDCSKLEDVYVSWETSIPTPLLSFDGVPVANVKLHVPCEKKSLYAAQTGWKDFNIVDPCEGIYPITAKEDPNNAGTYYSTFYYGTAKYAVPADVEAYAASVNGSDLVLTKIADANQVLPAGTAVILKSTIDSYTMVPSDGTAVTDLAGNQLQGVDVATTAPANCYVLSGHSSDNSINEVGFYTFSGTLGAHKAYLVLPGGSNPAPRHLRFVFNSTTDVESIQPSEVRSQKILRDGVLYIQRGEQLYNAQGMRVE